MKNKLACVCLFVALLLQIPAQAQPSVLKWIKRMRVIPTLTPILEHLSRSNDLPQIIATHPQSIRARDFLARNWITTLSALTDEISTLIEYDVPNWLSLANAYRHMDDPLAQSLAKFIYEHLIENRQVTNAGRSAAAIGISKIYDRQGIIQRSLNYAQYATVLNPNNGHAWHRLGDCLIGSIEDRWGAYENAYSLGSEEDDRSLMSKAYIGMGSMLEANGDLQTASFYFAMALHHDPHSQAAIRALKRVRINWLAPTMLYSPVRD